MTAGSLLEIWLTPVAAAPMRRAPTARLLTGRGLDGDRYALGGGTWAQYPDLEKQLTLIDAADVAAVAAEVGVPLAPGDTRRNLVTTGIDLPSLVGRWFAVGDALLFGAKRCPPCTHLERLTGARLVKAMVHRGGVNAAVFAGAQIAEGAVVRPVSEEEAARRGAPTGTDRPVPRVI
ncbi:MOSC domain-containing protein YiiM [Geodermatophilus bullaregiensis]|uniref:MOSC domain-containing protein n=1 Tax=Geodermatophilus bullaregiensis TaxID=1564160 RepID=UPI00195DB5CD|nr:MOSC domain-containing protein [Geodermatophilus bullaregiensis]MBM7807979.1 MOSC domain-containing protein YiiM [Geodermatophilus bullaregiensis]